jgi:hypothetical protein
MEVREQEREREEIATLHLTPADPKKEPRG